MIRLFNELTWSIRNGMTVKAYLEEGNIMNDPEIKRIVKIGFTDVLGFLNEMNKLNPNNELKKDIGALKEAIELL